MKVNDLKVKKSEHEIQVSCVNYFRMKYPKFLIWAIPNGGDRNVVVGKKLKDEGALSGVPDLHVPVAMKGFHGLYIEMKAGKNKPTDKQLNIMDKLRSEGYKCEVCYTLDEFIKVVDNYLK